MLLKCDLSKPYSKEKNNILPVGTHIREEIHTLDNLNIIVLDRYISLYLSVSSYMRYHHMYLCIYGDLLFCELSVY